MGYIGEKNADLWKIFVVEFLAGGILILGATGVYLTQDLLPAVDPLIIAVGHGLALLVAMRIGKVFLFKTDNTYSTFGYATSTFSLIILINDLVTSRSESSPFKNKQFNKFGGKLVAVFLIRIVAQFIGGIVASALFLTVFGPDSSLGRPIIVGIFAIPAGAFPAGAFAYEIIGSSIFLLIIISILHGEMSFKTGTETERVSHPAATISGAYAFLILIGTRISGGGLNMFEHLAPTLISNKWDHLDDTNDGVTDKNVDWIWYVAPLIGVAVALLIYWVLFYISVRVDDINPPATANASVNNSINLKLNSFGTKSGARSGTKKKNGTKTRLL